MTTADIEAPPAEPTPALPDYLTNPDAVLGDVDSNWRYGRAPDYTKTRKVFRESKSFTIPPIQCFLGLHRRPHNQPPPANPPQQRR
jgi:hypothetical protein